MHHPPAILTLFLFLQYHNPLLYLRHLHILFFFQEQSVYLQLFQVHLSGLADCVWHILIPISYPHVYTSQGTLHDYFMDCDPVHFSAAPSKHQHFFLLTANFIKNIFTWISWQMHDMIENSLLIEVENGQLQGEPDEDSKLHCSL